MSLSIIIPLRIDNEIRLTNLNHCLTFISKNFKTAEILVIENDKVTMLSGLYKDYPHVKFYYIYNSGRFSKSRAINIGLTKASMPVVIIWDVDVVINPEAINKAYSLMNKRNIKVIIPHNTIFVNIKGNLLNDFVKNFKFSLLPKFKWARSKVTNPNELDIYSIPSGVVMFDKNILIKSGGFNSNMISYGWEDIEVLKRLNKLGYYYYIMGKYNVIHFHHPRGIDSKTNILTDFNKKEFFKILKMNRKKLIEYIQDFPDPINTAIKYKFVNYNLELLTRIVNVNYLISTCQRLKHYLLTR